MRDADGDRLLGRGNTWRRPRGLVWLRQDYGAGLIQGDVYTELEVDGARGWTDHLPWSHVEGGAGLRGYGVRIQRIEAYSAGKASDMQFGLEPSGLMEA